MKRYALAFLGSTLLSLPCWGQYVITTLNYRGATTTRFVGMNDNFDIVGNYGLPGQPRHAMMYSRGMFIALDPTGDLGMNASAATQINNRGEISGWYSTGPGIRHGFVLRDGTVTTIDYPASSFSQVNGITDSGTIIGHFVDSAGVFHGYLLKGGIFSQIDLPGALDTLPFDMNVRGDIAGEWDSDPTQLGHAFVQMNSGEWVSFDAPGAAANSTLAIGINDHGEVLGFFRDSSGQGHTFLVNASNLAPENYTFPSLPPNASPETINNSEAFVSFYSDASGIHGLIATPHPSR